MWLDCFNGAITFSLWKFFAVLPEEHHRHRFNGAITFSLWKSPYAGFQPRLQLQLQWGHNFFVMEIRKESRYHNKSD